MEKYGVEERTSDSDREKLAQDTKKCPKCDYTIKDADSTGGVKVCPNCGTKPFEVE